MTKFRTFRSRVYLFQQKCGRFEQKHRKSYGTKSRAGEVRWMFQSHISWFGQIAGWCYLKALHNWKNPSSWLSHASIGQSWALLITLSLVVWLDNFRRVVNQIFGRKPVLLGINTSRTVTWNRCWRITLGLVDGSKFGGRILVKSHLHISTSTGFQMGQGYFYVWLFLFRQIYL